MRCPCKGCDPPKRHLRCHSNCEEYLSWAKREQEKKKRIEKDKADLINEDNKRKMWKRMRWR